MQPINNRLELSAEQSLYKEALALYQQVEKNHCHTLQVNGITMGYLDFGPPDATPLIWAHGSGFTRYELLNVKDDLLSAGYRVISIDYRGHGLTQVDINPESLAYDHSLYHIADDIARLMDHLKLERAVIGGLSKGGWIATAFYDAYPQRVLGLLLEDGGSFSFQRFAEDCQLGYLQPGPSPYPVEALKRLFNHRQRFNSLFEATQAVWHAYTPALSAQRRAQLKVENIATLLSFSLPTENGQWRHHCDIPSLMMSDAAGRKLESESLAEPVYSSRLPLMQQSQELMLPLVIFRNLQVPVHIIDPDSPTDWLPVRKQNAELQHLHPDLVVHEIYDYEHSPHEAHIERPERFVASAQALLERVKAHRYD